MRRDGEPESTGTIDSHRHTAGDNQDLPDEVSFLLTFGLWHVLVAAGFESRWMDGTQVALRREVI